MEPFIEVPHVDDIDIIDQVANEEILENVEQTVKQQVDQ